MTGPAGPPARGPDRAGDESARLLRALSLSDRFHLYLAKCATAFNADAIVDAIAHELPRLRGALVRVVRLDPYDGRTRDAPLTDAELADTVLTPLLDPSEEHARHGTVHVVDAVRATVADEEAWARFFALWNEKRNVLQGFGGEVVVLLPQALWGVFATAAPDVWSIRSGEYVILHETLGSESNAQAAFPSDRVQLPAPGAEIRAVHQAFWFSWRAIPPFALFGGDFEIATWLGRLVDDADDRPILLDRRPAEGEEPRILALRRLRIAERALAERDFAEAEEGFSELLDAEFDEEDPELEVRGRIGLGVALIGQDRYGEAIEQANITLPRLNGFSEAQAYALRALAEWCRGDLQAALEADEVVCDETGDASSARDPLMLERGPTKDLEADVRSGRLSSPTLQDYLALTDVPRAIRSASQNHELEPRATWFRALGAAMVGNTAESARLLVRAEGGARNDSEDASRSEAFRSYVRGVVALSSAEFAKAGDAFRDAERAMQGWAGRGLDRRALRRAQIAIRLGVLAAEARDEKPSVAPARSLVELAEALLGDPGQDVVARVLAVAACNQLALRLAKAQSEESRQVARRAMDLAAPLSAVSISAWKELARLTSLVTLDPR
jgi:hypothetical protein